MTHQMFNCLLFAYQEWYSGVPFPLPKPLQPETVIVQTEEDNHESVLITARNDRLINSYNPIQLSAWRESVDMQYCVSRHNAIKYVTKYATKCEPHFQTMKEIYTNIIQDLKDDGSALKVIQKLLVNSVSECDFLTQECSFSYLW